MASLERVSAKRLPADGTLSVAPSVDDATGDGNDYIEGNGGDDVIFGNLGQDDLIGGSSGLFSLTEPALRPDGSDMIFGGAGTDIARNDPGDETSNGHCEDADMILGDNGNIYRLVGTDGTDSGGFLTFNYDTYDTEKIVVRAAELLDGTPGGTGHDAPSAANDVGAADEIHGESGDDFIYGMVGDDVLFGEGQDDDLIGGSGNDWIAGGTGQDGVLSDDGRIYTSRNGTSGEPCYGIAGFADAELDRYIHTSGKIHQATINISGQLKKTVNLTPFEAGGNDIIYGGWGGDFLHGGAGDDALSGAEALPAFYLIPSNNGNVLRFGDTDRAGEFAAYDEYEPLRKILVDENGEYTHDEENGGEFLLNFDAKDGAPVEAGFWSDGDDCIFGDLGNDWLVGGTGNDHLYGGRGDDVLNADDDHDSTIGTDDPRANNVPDTHSSYEDIAYGGAGRDYLIANTGGDRLIDWAGEFNSYCVPFAPFGAFTITRAPQPHVMEYLYDLSASDGCDPTRAGDTGAEMARNGEPEGELGLVSQKDFMWKEQTGAPDDPQPGNIPGGRRDVVRSADFNSGTFEAFAVDSGVWEVSGGALQVSAASLGGDAASVFHVAEMLPSYFEIQATIAVEKPTAGWKANAYIIFDYYGPTDFKFAGLNASIDKMQMGHRTAEGWIIDVQAPAKIKPGVYYNMRVAVNGTNVTLLVDNTQVFSHTFEPRVLDGWVYGLNTGMVGYGSDNSRGMFDNIRVQKLPPTITFEGTEDFSDAIVDLVLVPQGSGWQTVDGRDEGAPAADGGDKAVSLVDLGAGGGLEVTSMLQLEATLNAGVEGGVVFDYYGPDNFKFAAISVTNSQIVIGHYTAKNGLVRDAACDMTVELGNDYEIAVALKGITVNLCVKETGLPNWQAMVGHVFHAVVVDGGFGLLSSGGGSSFDTVTVKTDDPVVGPDDRMAVAAPEAGACTRAALTGNELERMVDTAIQDGDAARHGGSRRYGSSDLPDCGS